MNVAEYWTDIVAAIGALVILARIIVKLTPTPKDNAIVERVINILRHVGLVIDTPK